MRFCGTCPFVTEGNRVKSQVNCGTCPFVTEGNRVKSQVNCGTCPFVTEGNRVKSQVTGELFDINYASDCNTQNLVYCIVCTKCKQNYIGETKRPLRVRFGDHLGYVRNQKLNESTGYHFNLPGHNITMIQITVLEKIWSSSDTLRKERETMYINKFESKYLGLNRKN